MIKKLIAIACAVVLSLSIVPQGFAEEEIFALEQRPQCTKSSKVIGEEIISEDDAFYFARASTQVGKTLYEVIEEGMRAHQKQIDISRFGYAATDKNKQDILKLLSRVIYENYDILSFTGYYPITSAGIIKGVKPMYLFDSYETDLIKRGEMNVIIDKYIEMAEAVPDVVGKLLIIHDAFSAENEYATEELAVYEEKNNASELTYDDMVIFTPYGALINNRSVCQGISIALAAIYNKLGIETGFCESDEKNHIWNVVKIDGKWYQLDATWNDSGVIIGKDEQGKNILAEKCFHNYFLVSDALMSDHGRAALWKYYTADAEVSCTDTTYESGQIYSGDYVYEGYNYGNWYGRVDYKDGRYVIDVWAVFKFSKDDNKVILGGTGFPKFYSNTLSSYGMIATEPHKAISSTGQRVNRIIYFSNYDINAKTEMLAAQYASGTYIGKKGGTIFSSFPAAQELFLLLSVEERKVMLWKTGTQEPVCEAREIN